MDLSLTLDEIVEIEGKHILDARKLVIGPAHIEFWFERKVNNSSCVINQFRDIDESLKAVKRKIEEFKSPLIYNKLPSFKSVDISPLLQIESVLFNQYINLFNHSEQNNLFSEDKLCTCNITTTLPHNYRELVLSSHYYNPGWLIDPCHSPLIERFNNDEKFRRGVLLKKLDGLNRFKQLDSIEIKTELMDDLSQQLSQIDLPLLSNLHVSSTKLKSLDFLSSFRGLRELSIAGNLFTEISGLYLPSLKDLRLLKIGQLTLPSLDFLKDMALEELWMEGCKPLNIEGLYSSSIGDSLRVVYLGFMSNMSTIDFLRGYHNIEELYLIGEWIENFNPLFETKSIKKLKMNRNHSFISLLPFSNNENIESLDVNYTGLRDYWGVVKLSFAKNGNLKKLVLPELIDWKNKRNHLVIPILYVRGVDIDLPNSYFSPLSRTLDNGLANLLINTGIPEEAVVGNRELWDYVNDVEKNEVISSNKNFHLKDKDGKRWLLKVHHDETRAKIEAAANYYLSNHFEFIVPGISDEPLVINGVYMTLQQDVSNELDVVRSIDYWIGAFALFHSKVSGIFQESKINLPEIKLLSLDDAIDKYDEIKKSPKFNIDKSKYNDVLQYFSENPDLTVIHSDPKKDNLKGKYLLDLELCGVGSPALDLSLLFMELRIPREKWAHYLRKYISLQGTENGESDLITLKEAVEHAAYYKAVKEIVGSSRRSIDQRTMRNNHILANYVGLTT